mmetsp:Transcript_81701/g.159512  ORF Transcript_81701/g.159512 Transcript_81701/m.159512 type:complete len:109 (-) Transcript_81701:32-358(-)
MQDDEEGEQEEDDDADAEKKSSGSFEMPFAFKVQNHMQPSSAGTPPRCREKSSAVATELFVNANSSVNASIKLHLSGLTTSSAGKVTPDQKFGGRGRGSMAFAGLRAI